MCFSFLDYTNYMRFFLLSCFLFLSALSADAQHWIQAGGSTTIDEGTAVVTDIGNNVYTTGYFTSLLQIDGQTVSSSGLDDIFILKTNPAGNIAWLKKAGGLNNDKGLAITTDAIGNVLVTGYFYASATFDALVLTSAGQQDVFIAKYSPAGTLLWVNQAGGSGSDAGNAITVDHSGNIIVTGEFSGTCYFGTTPLTSMNNSLDVFTAKYDGNGNLLWVKQGSAKYTDRGTSVATDAANNIYVSGMFSDTITFDATHNNPMYNSMFLIQYDSTGLEQWFRWMGSGAVVGMGGVAVHNNDVNITGNFRGTLYFFGGVGNPTLSSTHTYNIFVARYNTSGNLVWSHADGSDSDVSAEAITTRSNGEVVVAGNFSCRMSDFSAQYGNGIFCSVGFKDTYVSAYSNTGSWQWSRHYGGPREDWLAGIAIQTNGQLITTGSYENEFRVPTNYTTSTYHGTNGTDYWLSGSSVNYCSDNRYYSIVTYRSHGNKDLFLNADIDLTRQPFDYFARTGSVCSRPFHDICIDNSLPNFSCKDTVSVCGSTSLGVDLNMISGLCPDFNYLWNTGSVYNNISVSTSGKYSVRVTSLDGCFINTDTIYFRSYPLPPVPKITDSKGININTAITASIPLCLPDTVQLTCTNPGGYTVRWNGFPTGQNPITVTTGGTFSVTLTTANGCTETNYVQVLAGNALPPVRPKMKCLTDPDGNDSITLCLGDDFQMLPYDSLSNPSGSITCFPALTRARWSSTSSSFLSFSTYSSCSPPFNYFLPTDTGNFNFNISAWILRSNPCDTDSIFVSKLIHVRVHPRPSGTLNFSIAGPALFCPGDTVYLVAAPSSYNYSWSTGAVGDTLMVTQAGSYAAYSTQIVTNSYGCSASINGSAFKTVNPYPQPSVIMAPSSGLICPNDSVKLSCSGSGSFNWQGPNGNIVSTANFIYVNTPGFYYCIQTNTAGCALVSNTVHVIQYNIPLIIAFPGATICNSDTVVLTVISNPGSIIQWQLPLSGSATNQNIMTPGIYRCNVTSCGILTPLSFTVSMDSAIAEITASDSSLTFCDGDSILLTGNAGMANYLWMPPVQSGIECYASHGGPYVLITTSALGCTANDTIQITTIPNPLTPPVVNDTVLCAGLSTALFASGMDTMYWSFSPLFDTIIQTGQSYLTRQLFATTNYFVRSRSGTCKSASDTLTVFIDEHCNEILIPNIITPNNDGKNDLFPVIDGYYTLDIKIYDRWGRLIYESLASTVSWDGKNMAGNECPDGTYYYIVEVHFFDQTIQRQHGPVMLIR